MNHWFIILSLLNLLLLSLLMLIAASPPHLSFLRYIYKYIFFIDWFFKRERGGGREGGRETPVCCSNYLCMHWLILVHAWPGAAPATVAYQDDALTNWATRTGQSLFHFLKKSPHRLKEKNNLIISVDIEKKSLNKIQDSSMIKTKIKLNGKASTFSLKLAIFNTVKILISSVR